MNDGLPEGWVQSSGSSALASESPSHWFYYAFHDSDTVVRTLPDLYQRGGKYCLLPAREDVTVPTTPAIEALAFDTPAAAIAYWEMTRAKG